MAMIYQVALEGIKMIQASGQQTMKEDKSWIQLMDNLHYFRIVEVLFLQEIEIYKIVRDLLQFIHILFKVRSRIASIIYLTSKNAYLKH